MKILLAGLVKGSQALRLIEEGKNQNVDVVGCYTSDLILDFYEKGFTPYLKDSKYPLKDYDLIYVMAGGGRRWDWYVTAAHLNREYGTVIVNEKSISKDYNYYLASSSDYQKQVENSIPFPKSVTFFNSNSVGTFANKVAFPAIVKVSAPGMTSKGRGVFKVADKKELTELVKMYQEQANFFTVREFIPNDGDIRIFTVGYKAIGAMKRTPKQGDFKSNISQGGSGVEFDLSSRPDIKDIAEKLSLITRTQVAGVDIIIDKCTSKPYVLEINPGPQFEGLETYTNVNAAAEIIKYFISLV